jgi:hypothetical protein
MSRRQVAATAFRLFLDSVFAPRVLFEFRLLTVAEVVGRDSVSATRWPSALTLSTHVPRSRSERLWLHLIRPMTRSPHVTGARVLDVVRLNRLPWSSIGTISTAGKTIFGELAAARLQGARPSRRTSNRTSPERFSFTGRSICSWAVACRGLLLGLVLFAHRTQAARCSATTSGFA